ncbi:hypothetical protein GCM10023147_00390 [Tsukamurella soli]|uniref:Uncharacterized protein n=1 Tax=Tsukamurella soli TaxID=644556 RepID=A0ABP8J068_9ACTN
MIVRGDAAMSTSSALITLLTSMNTLVDGGVRLGDTVISVLRDIVTDRPQITVGIRPEDLIAADHGITIQVDIVEDSDPTPMPTAARKPVTRSRLSSPASIGGHLPPSGARSR